jgi:hypothetical protein
MHVTDPFGPTYAYQGETVTIEASLTAEQHQDCFAAAGIPAPDHDLTSTVIEIEPPGPREAANLRTYLCTQGIAHHSEMAVAFDPAAAEVDELQQLLELACALPMAPGELAAAAHGALAHYCAGSDEAAMAILFKARGYVKTRRWIVEAQAREYIVRALTALAAASRLGEGELDDPVHNAHSQLASEINNGGVEEQIRFLVGRDEADETQDLIEEAHPVRVAAATR